MINSDFIIEKYNKNKILVICNTVKKAQELYKEIKEKRPDLEQEIKLFHSGFIRKDRREKEQAILNFGNKDNVEGYGIWICTQVAEASLDIDFDILITELSDLNGLFQRMGRCYRSRYFNGKGYNCYLFTGGDKECSGVGYVINKKIFELSKKILENANGKISEEDKINLINDVYTTDKLKETNYYNQILDALKYIKSLYTNEMDKKRAKEMFRNINSITVIPEEVFENNKGKIEKYKKMINEREKDMTERK